MSNEFVMVPREWVECAVKAGAGEVMVLSDIATLAECLSQERQGEPVAWVYMRNGEVNYDADIVISNTEGDTLGDGDIWVPVFKEFDAIKSEYFERAYELSMESHKNSRAELDDLRAQLYETQRISQEEELRANRYSQQLAKQDALLARTLPYLSNTPDLVQHGAEDLAEEIRSASSGRPCYGPNEWGTECRKCSKCKNSSAEPSGPVGRDELTDEQIIEAMRSYLNDADGGYVVDTAPNEIVKAGRALLACAMQGAPVGRDERAKFESAYPGLVSRVRWDEAKQEYRSGSKGLGWQEGLKATEWLAVWRARAALDRKP